MIKYIWMFILGGLWLAWTIRAIVDGVQWFSHRNDCGFVYEEYGGWAVGWLVIHGTIVLWCSLTAFLVSL